MARYGRLEPRGWTVCGLASWFGVGLLVVVALDREGDEDQGEDAEDQRLDGVQHELQAEESQREDGDRQGGDDAKRDLTAIDVAEEPHGQRDGLDELEHEFDQADEQPDDAGADPLAELAQRDEFPR